jgi:hypothetical protein
MQSARQLGSVHDWGAQMFDVILIAIGCGCFAAAIAYAYACDRL